MRLIPLSIICCQCDSTDWVRCDPGQAADATSLPLDQHNAVLLFPGGVERAVVAWCRACDPLASPGRVVEKTVGGAS